MSFTPAELLMIALNCSAMKPSRMPQASVSSPCVRTPATYSGAVLQPGRLKAGKDYREFSPSVSQQTVVQLVGGNIYQAAGSGSGSVFFPVIYKYLVF